MKRIMIVGSGGAGKSTLSRQLSEILKIEVFHLDKLHWKPGWIETPQGEWETLIDNVTRKEKWIIDGNYGDKTLDFRFERADTIIFIDMPRIICLWRILKRLLMHLGKTRPDMGEGCPEKIEWDFIKWVWAYPEKSRPVILSKIQSSCADKRVEVLHRPKEVMKFLKDIDSFSP